MNSAVKKYDFEEIHQQLVHKNKWRNDVFVVYPFEAGSGKSRETQRFLGEMTKQYLYRALYVQRFIKDNQLQETVNRINKFAEKIVAFGVTGEDKKNKKKWKQAVDAQVLVCSHSMYKQICRGHHPELISKREILIIDERMDLVERISISIEDISQLWGRFDLYHSGKLIEELAEKLKEKFYHYSVLLGPLSKREMLYIHFEETDYSKYKKAIDELINSVTDQEQKKLLMRVQNLLKNGGFFFENKFHTFEDISFCMLENNLILDANGNFDATYQLFEDMFLIKKQPPIFDYSQSTLYHYEVKTGKGDLEKYIGFFENSLEQIEFKRGSKILFVTDKDSVEKIQEALLIKFAHIGDNLKEIEDVLGIKIEIQYFGNIIGLNDYRDFDTVAILKTPNYSYLDYSLMYLYYQKLSGRPIDNIRVFEHAEVETIRKSIIAGEIYQSIKRINRDLSKNANMYLFCSNKEAVEIVLNQLKNVQYVKREMTVEKKRKKYDNTKRKEQSIFEQKVTKVQKTLIELKKSKASSIRKKDIRQQVGILDKSQFAKILKALEPFLKINHIESQGQKLIFK